MTASVPEAQLATSLAGKQAATERIQLMSEGARNHAILLNDINFLSYA